MADMTTDIERFLLDDIADPRMTRDDLALTYAFGLRYQQDTIGWANVNRAIIDRWSPSALMYIKAKAWKRVER